MALTATIYHVQVSLSDVDRGAYESLELRLACHPSESKRYLLTRLFAYCFSYEEGIGFSKEGISSTEEPPISIRDPTGILVAWIDIGSPSAERLHKASKLARRVALYTHAPLALLQREAKTRPIHKVEAIEVWRMEAALLDAVEAKFDRHTKMEVVRNEGQVYVTIGGSVIEGAVVRCSLVEE